MTRTTRAEESYFTVQINAQNKNFITAEFSHDELSEFDVARNPQMYIVTRGDGTSQRDIRIMTPYQLEQEFDLPKNYRRGAFTKIYPKPLTVEDEVPSEFVITYFSGMSSMIRKFSNKAEAIAYWENNIGDPHQQIFTLEERKVLRSRTIDRKNF